MRWTDDTQMSIDLAESLVENRGLQPDPLARRFAAGYRWSRGYGAGAARLLRMIKGGADWREANRSVFSEGSFGNGGAMRAPVIGLFFGETPDVLPDRARDAARVTHAHPLAVEGAVLMAAATSAALRTRAPLEILDDASAGCRHEGYVDRLALARRWLDSHEQSGPGEVRKRLGNGIAALESCVTALYLALRFLDGPFASLHAFVVDCRGDVDTIGAMAGAVWGAANGAAGLPSSLLQRLEARERIETLAQDLFRARSCPDR
jgi:poly(ADP-ribose) glycohydrolase ARH3